MLLRERTGRLVQRDDRLTSGVVGIEALHDVVERGRGPGREEEPIMMFQDGPLALGHETR